MTAGQLAKRASLTKQLSNASDAALKEPSEGSRQAVETAEKNLADFVQELGKADPAFRDLQPEPSTTAEAQALAKQASCTILTYHLGGRRSQLWVVDAHGVRMLNLPARSRITTEVMALRQGLNRRPTDESKFRAYSDHAGTLYGWLFAPASRSVKPGGKILIVPTASSTTSFRSSRSPGDEAVSAGGFHHRVRTVSFDVWPSSQRAPQRSRAAQPVGFRGSGIPEGDRATIGAGPGAGASTSEAACNSSGCPARAKKSSPL